MASLNIQKLEEIIVKIFSIYKQVCDKWDAVKHERYNQRYTRANDVLTKPQLMIDVNNYCIFITQAPVIVNLINNNKPNEIVKDRAKEKSSIINKLKKYTVKKANGIAGKFGIHKCLNDLYGLRIIADLQFTYKGADKLAKQHKLRCVKKDKEGYKAIHIYFRKDDYHYQWELQLWNTNDSLANKISHAKYKQEYTKWLDKYEKSIKEKEVE